MTAIALRPGTLPWLLAHDIRMGWRSATASFSNSHPAVWWSIILVGALIMHVVAWPFVIWLTPLVHQPAVGNAPLAAFLVCTFTWMVAQSLFGATRTLYARGDLDLLLGSPLPTGHVFAAKSAAIAAGSFGTIGLLTLPIANVGAVLVGPQWLGVYPALIALALIATALGLALTMGLFVVLGPSRARLWTNMTGAVIAGAFVLAVQIGAMLPPATRSAIAAWIDGPAAPGWAVPVAVLRLPLEAIRGDIGSAVVLMTIALVMFGVAMTALAQCFANAGIAAAGASAARSHALSRHQRSKRFLEGLARNLRHKEWRLLVRDPGMFSQLALQIIYTVPVAVVLLRNEALPPVLALAPTIVVITAQVAASLAWLTVSGEDAPELIATAPVDSGAVARAKITAVALPVAGVIALPLAALAMLSMSAALLTAGVVVMAGLASALLNFWHPMPGKRRGMLRRHAQSKLIALVEHGFALAWALMIVLVLIGSWVAVLPPLLVAGTLAVFRHKARQRQ